MLKNCEYCKSLLCYKKKCAVTGCKIYLNECVLQSKKYCINCAADIYAIGETNQFKLLNNKYCQYCYKVKQPIGSSRLNGADHDDWEDRKFHKACYKLWKAERN